MREMVESVATNHYYLASMLLFVIGFHTMLTHSNLVKKVMGLNIMETAVFLFIVSSGYIEGAKPPIAEGPWDRGPFVNPLPSALILTGIVIAVSLTAFALSLIVQMYRFYGSLDADEIARIRLEEGGGQSSWKTRRLW